MDKRKLKEYIKKIPKAILYNGSERYVVTTENLDDILIIKIFFKGKKSELARSYELAWVHFYSKTERKYISYDLLGEFQTNGLQGNCTHFLMQIFLAIIMKWIQKGL